MKTKVKEYILFLIKSPYNFSMPSRDALCPRSRKFAIAGVVFLMSGAVIGSAYWYAGVYMPRQYVREILSIYTTLGSRASILYSTEVKSVNDYVGAEKILGERFAFINDVERRIEELRAPLWGEGRKLDLSFRALLRAHKVANEDARRRLDFLSSLHSIIEIFDNPPQLKGTPVRMRDVQSHVNENIPKVYSIGDRIFATEPPELGGEIPFVTLKASWVESRPAFEVIATVIRAQDPNSSDSLSPNLLTAREREEIEKAAIFFNLGGQIFRANTAYDVLAYRFLDENLQLELQERTEDLGKRLRVIKETYSPAQ